MDGIPGAWNPTPEVAVELRCEGDRFLGLGSVRVRGVALRDPRLPILPEIRSADAVEFTGWRILSARMQGGGLDLELEPQRRNGGLMEWMLHRVHNRYRVSDWTAAPAPASDTRLTIELRPVERRFAGQEAIGFSYRYRYRSASVPIHRILDRASWEPGGAITGNEFWLRVSTAKPIMRFDRPGLAYSSEWCLPGIRNPSIFQFQPFQTQFNGFTMTVHPAGALVTWVAGVAHVRSLFETLPGGEAFLHLHEHCDDLGDELSTCPVEILWIPGQRDRIANANLWESVREHVFAALHAEAGIREERVDVYGVVEEWGRPDFRAYTREAVPALLAAGVRQVMIPNQFENNMNVWGISNMCCTVDLKIAESVGEEALRGFCQALRDGGAVVHHWGNTALSTMTVLLGCRDGEQGRIDFLPQAGSAIDVLSRSGHAFLTNMAGHHECDHYSPRFCQLNLRDPAVREYWHRSWREARDRVGFGGIFLDSSFNLSSDKFHWVGQVDATGSGATIDQVHLLGQARPADEPPKAILSQYKAHLRLIAEMQAYGYAYSGEDIGVFGVHRSGPDMAMRLDNLFMWSECYAVFDPGSLRRAGADPAQVFFAALAHRCMWMLFWQPHEKRLVWRQTGARDADEIPSPDQLALLAAFHRANADMQRKTMLPDEAGVVWRGGSRTILWAFADQDYAVPAGAAAVDLIDGTAVRIEADRLPARARRVYAIA